MNINQYAVYQLKESAELAAYRSRSYQYLTEHHFQVIVQNYQQAYFTKLFTSDTPEMIRKRLEEHRPKNFRGRPFGVGDVIVINQQGEITAYFVDKDSLVVVAGFIRSSSSGILVTLDTKNLFIDGCAGTWMATEECVVESQHFFLMQHEVYKEKAPNVIVDASGKLVSTEIRKGLDAVVVDSIFRCGRTLPFAIEALQRTFYPLGIQFAVVEDDFCSADKTAEEVAEYFNGKTIDKIYTLPSDLEGMPLSLLEAMSYGNCCLVSDIPECAEVVEDKALIFQKTNVEDLQEKLQDACDHPEMVMKMKNQAADFICAKYNWDEVVDKTLALYGEKSR